MPTAVHLALKEIWRNRGRFLLFSLVVGLITVLILFVAAFESAQMGSVEQDERWAEVAKLAYWQLYVSRNVVECDVRPWERYKPQPPADQPATPSQTRRAFGRLLPDLGTPARAPQPRGKSPGRPKGYQPEPRKRFPVVYKGRKQPPSLT